MARRYDGGAPLHCAVQAADGAAARDWVRRLYLLFFLFFARLSFLCSSFVCLHRCVDGVRARIGGSSAACTAFAERALVECGEHFRDALKGERAAEREAEPEAFLRLAHLQRVAGRTMGAVKLFEAVLNTSHWKWIDARATDALRLSTHWRAASALMRAGRWDAAALHYAGFLALARRNTRIAREASCAPMWYRPRSEEAAADAARGGGGGGGDATAAAAAECVYERAENGTLRAAARGLARALFSQGHRDVDRIVALCAKLIASVRLFCSVCFVSSGALGAAALRRAHTPAPPLLSPLSLSLSAVPLDPVSLHTTTSTTTTNNNNNRRRWRRIAYPIEAHEAGPWARRAPRRCAAPVEFRAGTSLSLRADRTSSPPTPPTRSTWRSCSTRFSPSGKASCTKRTWRAQRRARSRARRRWHRRARGSARPLERRAASRSRARGGAAAQRGRRRRRSAARQRTAAAAPQKRRRACSTNKDLRCACVLSLTAPRHRPQSCSPAPSLPPPLRASSCSSILLFALLFFCYPIPPRVVAMQQVRSGRF